MSRYITGAFSAFLQSGIAADANTLPLASEAENDLLALLADEETYTYATLRDDQSFETVRLYVQSGVLLVERGLGGTQAVSHRCGAHVFTVSPTTLLAIKDIICQYDCCEDTDCPCESVSVLGSEIADEYKVGEVMTGYVIFGGTAPMAVTTSGAPDWMKVVHGGNTVFLSGTPTRAAEVDLVIAATNCNGTYLCVSKLSFSVVE